MYIWNINMYIWKCKKAAPKHVHLLICPAQKPFPFSQRQHTDNFEEKNLNDLTTWPNLTSRGLHFLRGSMLVSEKQDDIFRRVCFSHKRYVCCLMSHIKSEVVPFWTLSKRRAKWQEISDTTFKLKRFFKKGTTTRFLVPDVSHKLLCTRVHRPYGD